MSEPDIPYAELDANMVNLVRALNTYPELITIGSCGGHEVITNPSQWEAGTWYVKFRITPGKLGWLVLEHLAWAINNDFRRGHKNVYFMPIAAPPYLNGPGTCLYFVIEGYQHVDPERLAGFLNSVRNDFIEIP